MTMTEIIPIGNLQQLDEEARDDACYRARDRAWSALVILYEQYYRTQKLSYEALGRRINRSRSQVQRWLSSSYNMNLTSLGLLAEGLDADLIIEVRPRLPLCAALPRCHPREAAKARAATRSVTLTSAENRVRLFQAPQTSSASKPEIIEVHRPDELVLA